MPLCICDGLISSIQLGADWLAQQSISLNYSSRTVEFPDGTTLPWASPSVTALTLLPSREKAALLDALPAAYHNFLDIFSDPVQSLPPQRGALDHEIILEPNTKPIAARLRPFSTPDHRIIDEHVQQLLRLGHIVPSKSPWASNITIAHKSDGSPRVCFNYRPLNGKTIRNQYPFPNIDEIFYQLQGSTIFTKIDLRNAYHLLRVRKEDEPLTAFRTRHGLYQFRVLPFGLVNAPASFQAFINSVLADCLGKFALSYLDDLIVFSRDLESHIQHVKHVLSLLQHNQLTAKISKCLFHASSVPFLGHILSTAGLSIDPQKTLAVASGQNHKMSPKCAPF